MSRTRGCEICGESAGRLCALDLQSRIVRLCKAHARAALEAGARSVEALRALFVEPGGRRALLGRRARDERRQFPPRPEGRRLARGRRASDRPAALGPARDASSQRA